MSVETCIHRCRFLCIVLKLAEQTELTHGVRAIFVLIKNWVLKMRKTILMTLCFDLWIKNISVVFDLSLYLCCAVKMKIHQYNTGKFQMWIKEYSCKGGIV